MAESGCIVMYLPVSACIGRRAAVRLATVCLTHEAATKVGIVAFPGTSRIFDPAALVVESVDTRDLKSRGHNRPCGFDSRPGH